MLTQSSFFHSASFQSPILPSEIGKDLLHTSELLFCQFCSHGNTCNRYLGWRSRFEDSELLNSHLPMVWNLLRRTIGIGHSSFRSFVSFENVQEGNSTASKSVRYFHHTVSAVSTTSLRRSKSCDSRRSRSELPQTDEQKWLERERAKKGQPLSSSSLSCRHHSHTVSS